MRVDRFQSGLLTTVESIWRVVKFMIAAVLALPVVGTWGAYRYFSGKKRLGPKRSWSELSLRRKYNMRRIEIGFGFIMVAWALNGLFLWMMLATWAVQWIVSLEGGEWHAYSTVVTTGSMIFVVLLIPIGVTGMVLSWNDARAIRGLKRECASLPDIAAA